MIMKGEGSRKWVSWQLMENQDEPQTPETAKECAWVSRGEGKQKQEQLLKSTSLSSSLIPAHKEQTQSI